MQTGLDPVVSFFSSGGLFSVTPEVHETNSSAGRVQRPAGRFQMDGAAAAKYPVP